MSNAFFEKQDYDEAIKFADSAIKLNEKNDKAYVAKSEALLATYKREEALETALKAIEIKPDSFFAYNSKGTALEKLGDLEGALAAFDKAIELDSYDEITDLSKESKTRVETKITMKKHLHFFWCF